MILSKSRGVTTIFNMNYMHVLSKSETITKQKRLCYYLLKLKDTWSNNGRDIIVGIPAKNEWGNVNHTVERTHRNDDNT